MQWWIVGNRYGGWRAVPAATAAEARGWVRDGIAESFRDEGLSDRDALRAASSYGVHIIAGGCNEDEARAAVRAWDDGDGWPAQHLHDRWIAGTRRSRQYIAADPPASGWTGRHCRRCNRAGGELTENGCPTHGDRHLTPERRRP